MVIMVEWCGWLGKLGLAWMVRLGASWCLWKRRASVEKKEGDAVWLFLLRHWQRASDTRPARGQDRHLRPASESCRRWIGPWWNWNPTRSRPSRNRKRL